MLRQAFIGKSVQQLSEAGAVATSVRMILYKIDDLRRIDEKERLLGQAGEC